jgi:thioredoxin-like negative regulator of GroEL
MKLEFFTDLLFLRIIASLAIIAGGYLLYRLVVILSLRRARSRAAALPSAGRNIPVLLYFTTPTCAPCKTVQRPAIQRLQEQLGNRLQVIEVDASAQPEFASQWGVLSVPTTYLIDRGGQPRHVNHGVASAEKLMTQIQDIL